MKKEEKDKIKEKVAEEVISGLTLREDYERLCRELLKDNWLNNLIDEVMESTIKETLSKKAG